MVKYNEKYPLGNFRILFFFRLTTMIYKQQVIYFYIKNVVKE